MDDDRYQIAMGFKFHWIHLTQCCNNFIFKAIIQYTGVSHPLQFKFMMKNVYF